MTEPAQEVMSEEEFDAWVNELFRNPPPISDDLKRAMLYADIIEFCQQINTTPSSVRILPSKKE
jgi:hypothetical protein